MFKLKHNNNKSKKISDILNECFGGFLGDFKTTNYSNNVAEIMKTISNFLVKSFNSQIYQKNKNLQFSIRIIYHQPSQYFYITKGIHAQKNIFYCIPIYLLRSAITFSKD